jgi:colanic acid/amylovoran biosynthesis glycosyltransferase
MLAVFTNQLGTISETFIRRHIEDVMPGRTVAVARSASHPLGGRWTSPCPVLYLDEKAQRLSHRLARRAGFADRGLTERTVESFLKKHNVEVVLGEYLDQFVDFVPLLDRLQIPYVVQGHGIDVSAALRAPGMADRYLAFRSARAVLTRCEFHRQRLIELGLPKGLVKANPGGVDIPSEIPTREPAAWKRFLAVGRMVPKKGPIYLLESFRRAATADPDITLDYIGGGELLAAARQYVDAAGLSDRVRLRGMVTEEEKKVLWGECGVFLQHSITDPDTGDEEGLPAAIQEAMAAGMVVVTTAHSGIPEAIEHGVTGCVVPERDVTAMADAILNISRGEPANAGLSTAAYKKAANLYSWTAERERILAAMQML